MVDIFGKEIKTLEFEGITFRPVPKFGIPIPDYWVSYCGKILSTRCSKPKILNPQYKTKETSSSYISPRIIGCRVPKGFFEDYDHTSAGNTNKDTASIGVKIHRAVMEAWKPIDEFPPIPKEEWDACPESAKQFMRDAAIIDHEDDDTLYNHGDNLSWSTNKDNNNWRKHAAKGSKLNSRSRVYNVPNRKGKKK